MRRTPRLGGVLLLALCLAGPSVLHAQDADQPATLEPGQYDGSLSFTGGFIIDVSQAIAEMGQDTGGADVSGQMVLDSAINGPASMTVGDAVSGDWSLAGTSTTTGRFTGVFQGITATINIDGSGVYDAAGVFSGAPNAAMMTGTFNSTSTATVNANGFEQSATTSDSQELSLTLTDPIGDCGRAFARVDLEIRQQVEEIPGATATIIGVFTGDTLEDGYEFTEIEALNASISELWNNLDSPDRDPMILLSDAFVLLSEVEAVEDSLVGLDCGENPDFANAMTLLGAELVRVVLDLASDFDADLRLVLIDRALEMGLRTGALGSGRGDIGGARQIASTAETMLGEVFSEASRDGDLETVEGAAVLARQYGWELVNDAGVTSTDALLVFGE